MPLTAGKPNKNCPARGRSAGVYGVPSALFDGVAACIPIRKSRGRIGQTARLLMAAEEGGNMSSRIFQNVIIQLKDAVDRTIGVVDEQGFVVACSELAMIGSRLDDFHLYEFDGTEPHFYRNKNLLRPLFARREVRLRGVHRGRRLSEPHHMLYFGGGLQRGEEQL